MSKQHTPKSGDVSGNISTEADGRGADTGIQGGKIIEDLDIFHYLTTISAVEWVIMQR